MSRFDGGFFKFYRKAFRDEFGKNPELLALWTWILGSANIFESKIMFGKQQKTLAPGMLWISQDVFSKEWEWPRYRLRRHLDYLQKTGRIKTETGRNGTIITVCKWSDYQIFRGDEEQKDDRKTTEDRTKDELKTNAIETKDELKTNESRTRIEELKKERKKEGKKERRIGVARSPNGASPKTPGSEVWDVYVEAYRERYGVDPVRNADTNRHCKKIVESVGAEEAKQVVRFYVGHNKAWYVQGVHDLKWCAQDAAGLFTQLRTNTQVTGQKARQTERSQSNLQIFTELAAEFRDRETEGQHE